jgi:hypothetical protein
MSENARELYALNGNYTTTDDGYNRFEDANRPVRLADGTTAEKWADHARELIGNRTEARDDFGQHMETVRRRTEEQFKRENAGYTDDRIAPKKLSEHRRKHLHLYSNKPGSGQSAGTAATRNRSESPHGIDVQSARTRKQYNGARNQRDNEEVDG